VELIGLVYAIASVISFAAYGLDKRSSMRGARRVPERSLHLIDLLGGWPGGLVAQRVFRHKTRKLSFQGVFWGIVAGHLIAWGWWIWMARS